MPNLIFSWWIERNPIYEPIRLDFIALCDFQTYETHINECDECCVRNTNIQLTCYKDKSLHHLKNKEDWNQKLMQFCDELSAFAQK